MTLLTPIGCADTKTYIDSITACLNRGKQAKKKKIKIMASRA
jgi:hypothetical protein